MSQQISTDIVIVGGGIAGLWLNARLHQLGYSTLLIESKSLGGEQTVKSQGIIHGGTKYTLAGTLTGASEAIATMPKRWRDCLAGNGELNLSQVNVLSQHHFLWSPGNLASNLMSFFASKALRSRVQQVKGDDLPIALQHSQFKGKAYRLDEIVLDIPSVIQCLVDLSDNRVLLAKQIEPLTPISKDQKVFIKADDIEIETKQVILSAGEGNGQLLNSFHLTKPAMQVRPLHMVMVKSAALKPLYAHCLGVGVKPRLTVTTHYHQDGDMVWYIGGELAEEAGVARDEAAQIDYAKAELAKLVPWIDLTTAQWATLRVNRAEPAQTNLMRPDNAFISVQAPVIIGWPTKLALAPDFADQCIASLQQQGIQPQGRETMPALPTPPVANTVWNELFK